MSVRSLALVGVIVGVAMIGSATQGTQAQVGATDAQNAELTRRLADIAARYGNREREAREAMTAARKDQCVSVVGSDAFCGCIIDNLPATIDFPKYVGLVTGTLSGEPTAPADAAMTARDKCVAPKSPTVTAAPTR